MIDYENKSTSDVQRLARQGDKHALYEMAWRIDLLPDVERKNPIEGYAWRSYWWKKAADAGHINARFRYARLLIDRPINFEDRQEAMNYYQSLSNDFDNGQLDKGEDEERGIIAKLWLGIMLCEGYHTKRDAKKGVELINFAKKKLDNFYGFGFMVMYQLGILYSTGLVDPSEMEEPTLKDLEQGAEFYKTAIERFDPNKDNKGIFDIVNNHFEHTKNWIEKIRREGGVLIFEWTEDDRKKYTAERRIEKMKLSDDGQKQIDTVKTALKRLHERLAREGW